MEGEEIHARFQVYTQEMLTRGILFRFREHTPREYKPIHMDKTREGWPPKVWGLGEITHSRASVHPAASVSKGPIIDFRLEAIDPA